MDNPWRAGVAAMMAGRPIIFAERAKSVEAANRTRIIIFALSHRSSGHHQCPRLRISAPANGAGGKPRTRRTSLGGSGR
jgi:hypothetical protein